MYNSNIIKHDIRREPAMKNKKDIKKIVLAYSGGLDTSIIIPG